MRQRHIGPAQAQKNDLFVGTFWAAAIPQTRVERFGGICDPIFDERMSRTDGVVDLSMDPFWPFRSECSSEVGENETSYYAKDVVEHLSQKSQYITTTGIRTLKHESAASCRYSTTL